MRHKCSYLCLLLFSLAFVLRFLWERDDSKSSLLILPYEYYEERDETLLDLPDFRYLLTSHSCSEKNVTHIQIVTSYAGNVETRGAIRRAYPSSELENVGVLRVFLLATLPPFHEVSQNALVNESQRYGDLVQGNFLEAYKNLTYKHVMGIKWAVKHCHHARYIIKSDDDIIIDMYSLVNFIEKTDFHLMGYLLKNMRPIRLKTNKWYVTKGEFSANTYPPFLSGWLYVMDTKTANRLLSHTKEIRYFWIDDLFVTGLLSEKANITMVDMSTKFSLHPEVVECCLRKGLACGFLAAPNGGDNTLHIKFQAHSKICYVNKCPTLPPGVKVEDRCVTKHKLPKLQKGLPRITVIQ